MWSGWNVGVISTPTTRTTPGSHSPRTTNWLVFNLAVADAAHARGPSIGLKNGASPDGSFERAIAQFTDWALNEECNTFDECSGYSVYIDQNKAVFQVEYMNPGGTRVEDFCAADTLQTSMGCSRIRAARSPRYRG